MVEFQGETVAGAMCSRKRREASQAPAGKLEEFCGRAALLAGAIERDAGAGFGLKLDGWMADDLCEGERCSVERKVAVPDLRDYRGVCGAVLGNGREGDSRCGGFRADHAGAVVRAVPPATGRETRFRAGGDGEHRRDQREAEEEE
jgi:hypothetical protein